MLRILAEDTAAKNAQVPDDLLSPPVVDTSAASPSGTGSKRNSSQIKRDPSPSGLPPLNTTGLVLKEDVMATLSPLLSPGGGISARPSADISRASSDVRRSMDLTKLGRRSVDLSRMNMDGGRRSVSASRRSLSRNRLGERRVSEKQDSSDSYVHSMEEPSSSAAVLSASEETQASASQILRGSDVFLSPTIQRSSSASRAPKNDNGLRLDGMNPSHPARKGSNHGSIPPTPRAATQPVSHAASSTGKPDTATGTPYQGLMKAGAYPFQRAAGLAGFVNKHSKRMSTLLATESMGYVEKVSGMWKGGKKHYDEPSELATGDEPYDEDDEAAGSGDRFRDHFALPDTEKLQAAYFGFLHKVLPLYGKIYISDRSFCFRSLLPGTRTKLILPLKDIENVDKEKGFRFGYSGLVVVIRGHEELFFEFNLADIRDDCAITLIQNLETVKYLKESGLLSMEEKQSAEEASAEHRALQQARKEQDGDEHDLDLPKTTKELKGEQPPIMFDDPRASILNFKPTESLRITCLTIGSRGDVQPYIALCKGLIAEGHKPRIATHHEFKDWVEGHGIEFRPVEGDPAELMRICVENGMFTYSFLREASSKFRGWIDELLSSGWQACQGSDLLIESPSAMGGIHIAEALQIPYFRAFSMPWTRTRAYPHAFAVPEHKMGGAYNYITYVMFDNVFWKAIAGQVNRWRKHELGLRATSLEKMQPNKVPFLYMVSPSVVVPPLDYSDWIRVTGYWFLDEGAGDWKPPKDLTDFIQKARSDGKRIVYVGFGSIVVADSAALTNTIVASVLKADVRCILSKGWSDRLDAKTATTVEVSLPPEILQIKSAPHDWLFKQIDAAAHHGGAGTTGASLRAGLPTIIKPFFGDQYFFGNRVEDLGVGIHLRKMNVSVFSRALWEAAHSERMIIKAKVLGEQIRSVCISYSFYFL